MKPPCIPSIRSVKKNIALLAACAGALGFAWGAAGAPQKDNRGVWVYSIFVFEGKKGEWTNEANWRKREQPSGELPRVNVLGGRTVTLSTPITDTLSLLVLGGDKGPQPSELYIKSGARLNVGGIWMPNAMGANSAALIDMAGGDLTVGKVPGHSYFFDVGYGATTSGTARFAISGGNLGVYYGLRVGSSALNTNTGSFAVKGSACVIVLDSKSKSAFRVDRFGTLEFVLDKNGVSTINAAKSRFALAEGATLRVNGAAYEGGNKDIILIQARELAQEGKPNLETADFPAGYSAKIQLDGKTAVLSITKSAR